MKLRTTSFSERYLAALRRHLKQVPVAKVQRPFELGRNAVALGIDILGLARIHERSIATLEVSTHGNRQITRADRFFSGAIKEMMEAPGVAQFREVDLSRLNDTLRLRTAKLAATNRQIEQSVGRRKRIEATLKQSGEHYARLLMESLQLQGGLRQLTHQVLATQEVERKNISRELQDEIAQTLLGINVRLLLLKQEAASNAKCFKRGIASTQRLVAKSTRSMYGVTGKIGKA